MRGIKIADKLASAVDKYHKKGQGEVVEQSPEPVEGDQELESLLCEDCLARVQQHKQEEKSMPEHKEPKGDII